MRSESSMASVMQFLLCACLVPAAFATPVHVRVTDDPADSREPCIASNVTEGNLSVVWIDDRSGAGHVYLSRYQPSGTVTLDDRLVYSSLSPASEPSCGVDSQGNTYITWLRADAIWYTKVSPTGVILVAAKQVVAAPVDHPRIDVDNSGNGYLVWVTASGTRPAKYRRLNNAGNFSCSEATLDQNQTTLDTEYPFVIAPKTAANPYAYFSWHGDTVTLPHYMNVSYASGCTVGGPFQQTNDIEVGRSAMAPLISTTSAYMAFEGRDGTGAQRIYWLNTAGSYRILDAGLGFCRRPVMASTSDAAIVVGWETVMADGTTRIFAQAVTTDPQTVLYGPNQAVSLPGVEARHPGLARTSSSHAFVWEQGPVGSSEIYVSIRGLLEAPRAGATVLAHGFDVTGQFKSPVEYWSESFVAGILLAFGGGEVFVYQPGTGEWDADHRTAFVGTGLFKSAATGGHLVLVHDWGQFSNDAHAGEAEAAAGALFAALSVTPVPTIDPAAAATMRPLHFIGHSRGSSVASETIQRIGQYGIPVDYFTSLDPHDFSQGGILFDEFFHDPAVQVWDNVLYADNFYQDGCVPTVCTFQVAGRRLPHLTGGAANDYYNGRLNDLPGFGDDCFGCDYPVPHVRVVDWYRGTIRGGIEPDATVWYSDDLGFNVGFSRWFSLGGFDGGGLVSGITGKADPVTCAGLYPFGDPYEPWIPDGDDDFAPTTLFNGDFHLGDLDVARIAGWEYHGGGGTGTLGSDGGNRFLRLTSIANTRKHDRFLVPFDATVVNFTFRGVSVTGDAALYVTLSDAAGAFTAEAEPVVSMPVLTPGMMAIPPAFQGKVCTLEFVFSGMNGEVWVDDVAVLRQGQFFARTAEGEAVSCQLGPRINTTFTSVTSEGMTQLFEEPSGPPLPLGVRAVTVGDGTFLNLTTTASFAGDVTLGVHYDPAQVLGDESELLLLHYLDGRGWEVVTSSRDPEQDEIEGIVSGFSTFALVEPDGTTGAGEREITPGVWLSPPWPNPLQSGTCFELRLRESAEVSFTIYSPTGRRVRALVAGTVMPAGEHRLEWDGTDDSGKRVSAGVHFYELRLPTNNWHGKIVVLR